MPFTSRLQTLARRVARFDWVSAPLDTAANLYQTVIPAAERRQLGEYYTPSWLARVMVRELVDDPLNQRVLDPACGSGTFVAEAVTHFIAAAEEAGWAPEDVLSRLRDAVTGIDSHSVAVHLARAAWILAAHPAVRAATAVRLDASMSIPVYFYSSSHPTGSHGWRNQFDLGNPDLEIPGESFADKFRTMERFQAEVRPLVPAS